MARSTHTADEYEFVDHDETALSPEALSEIRTWLQPTDYLAESGEFRRHLASQAPGTGLWICQTDEYKKWHDSPDHGSLWIKGVPGAGKSVTAASIIQHLRSTEDCPVLFFFFRNIVAANFSPRALIQDWLAQLLPHSPKLQYGLKPRLKSKLVETSDKELIDLFLDGVSGLPKVYCIGDALDEMNADSRPFLDKLNSLATFRPDALKLLITSRPKQYLQSALRDSSIVHISLQQQLVDADIVSYLHHRFDTAPKDETQLQMKQQVINMVARRSEGLFLYAKLTMDQVEESLRERHLVDIAALEASLPVGLEQTYASVLARQRQEEGVSEDIQLLVLEAVTHASRPLRLYELAGMIKCIRPDAAAPHEFKQLVVRSCGPLVEIMEDETLQVIHHSFTEFLRGDNRSATQESDRVLLPSGFLTIDPSKAHRQMAINCLTYLKSGGLLRNTESDSDIPQYKRNRYSRWTDGGDPFDYREARLSHPFLRYSVDSWPDHARHYDVKDDEFFRAVVEFLQPESLTFHRWLRLNPRLRTGTGSLPLADKKGVIIIPTMLHIACFCGMSELARRLIREGADTSAVDGSGCTPLHWASKTGHAKIVSMLLGSGCDPDVQDDSGYKPIYYAARDHGVEVILLLLKADAVSDTVRATEAHDGKLTDSPQLDRVKTAASLISGRDYQEAALALIPFCTPELLDHFLCECFQKKATDTALAILRNSNASVNAEYYGGSPLHFACLQSNVKCVEALLKLGANPNQLSACSLHYSPRHRSRHILSCANPPVHSLVSIWTDGNDTACQAILRMLVQAGADINQLNERGFAALFHAVGVEVTISASSTVSIPALRGLLNAGADVHTRYGPTVVDTALHILLREHRHLDATKLLLEHGLDPNDKDSQGRTALHCCLAKDSRTCFRVDDIEPVVRCLLEHGADPNMKNSKGESSVALAKNHGLEVFQILFSRCTDDFTKTKCWFALGGELRIEQFSQYLELFLAAGIDINRRNENGQTLYLCCATCYNPIDRLRILKNRGAKTDVVDNQGNNAQHLLRGYPRQRLEFVQALVAESGIDPFATNNIGDTLLHCVAYEYKAHPGYTDFIRYLVKLGLSVNAQNNNGRTPLHLYVAEHSVDRYSPVPGGKHFLETINEHNSVDFEMRDMNGLSALHLAALHSDVEFAVLVEAGARIEALTEDGQTALHLACRARRPNTIGVILSRRGDLDIDHQDCFGRTALHYACSSGELESVATLLRHGANVHIVDYHGCTPLHACAEFRMEQAVWEARGDERHNLRNRWARGPPDDPLRPGRNWTWSISNREPWYDAFLIGESVYMQPFETSAHGITPTVRLLLEAGCDPAAVNDKKATALDTALQYVCTEFVELFVADEQLFLSTLSSSRVRPSRDSDAMEENNRTARQRMKALMRLMLPRSAFPILGQDTQALEEVRKFPSLYLKYLNCNDAAALINANFAADPLDAEHYTVLEQVLKSGRLDLVRSVSSLVLHFSSYASVEWCLKQRLKGKNSTFVKNQLTALQLVCESERPDIQLLKLLVEDLHVDVNAREAVARRDKEAAPGRAAVHILAAAEHWWQVDGLRYLLEQGVDANTVGERGETALHIAATTAGPLEVAKLTGTRAQLGSAWGAEAARVLLDHGADPNILNEQHQSPLHKAINRIPVMRLLLDAGADPNAGPRGAIFEAIYEQNLEALAVLLDHGASANSIDKVIPVEKPGESNVSRKAYALIKATTANKPNTIVFGALPLFYTLVRRGADPYVPLNETETLMHHLFEHRRYDVLDVLLQEPASRVEVHQRDQRGRTLLHAACENKCNNNPKKEYKDGQLATIPLGRGPLLFLLDMGADATLVDRDGNTALHSLLRTIDIPDWYVASFIDREEVAPTLLTRDGKGLTPLHLALLHFRPSTCNRLVAKGADILEPDADGWTALHHIAKSCVILDSPRRQAGRNSVVKLEDAYFHQSLVLWQTCLAVGGSINAADKDGDTPLHTFMRAKDKPKSHTTSDTSLRRCHLEYYDQLFRDDSPVDVFALNNKGETALHAIASRRKPKTGNERFHDTALFQKMMAKGLDPLQEDFEGRSALDVASACEKDDILSLFNRK